MSSGNDQSSTEFKSKRMVSFAKESGKYKLIECKGDSSVAFTIYSFAFVFVVVLAPC